MYVSLPVPYHNESATTYLFILQGYCRMHTLAWSFPVFNCIERPFAGRDQLGERDEEEVGKASLDFLP